MLNRAIYLICIFAILAGNAFGTTYESKFTGAASCNWNNPSNWDLGRVPYYWNDGTDKGDIARINYISGCPAGVTISSGDYDVYSLYISRWNTAGDAILNCVSGSLTSKGYDIRLGCETGSKAGILNMYDGFTLTNQSGGGGTAIGYKSDGTLNMHGGTFNHNSGPLKLGQNGAIGILNLYGGIVNMNVWSGGHVYMEIGAGSKIRVGGGVMKCYGANYSFLVGLIDSGKIEAMSGDNNDLQVEYISAENYTYLWSDYNGPVEPEPDVIVDFSLDVGPAYNRASGFLHSLSPTAPEMNMITVLKPNLFRMSPTRGYGDTGDAFENYDRVHNEIGADIHLVLSGSFRDTVGGWPGDNGSWTSWENYINWIMDLAIGGNYVFQYDIWNEPNGEAFWNPDGAVEEKTQRFFEAWKRAWQIIKSRDPDAIIAGPSNSWFGPLSNRWFTVEEFLAFANANNVLPDVLTWHTWNEDTIIPDVAHIRAFMISNGFYIDKIVINEYGGSIQHTQPGDAVWYFANMEEAEVDGGVRTCTIDPWGCSTCWNVSLTGLLTHPDGQPRSTWWAYKNYAEITGTSVEVISGNYVNGVAAKDDDASSVLRKPQAKVLLGKRDGVDSDYTVLLSGLEEVSYLADASGNVRVVIEHIPCSDWDPLASPVFVSDDIRSFSDEISVTLPDFGTPDAYVISLYHPNTYIVNMESLALFMLHWLDDNGQSCLEFPMGDINNDCKVDFIDYSTIANYWIYD